MKKSKVKQIVDLAIQKNYGASGLTNTAAKVRAQIFKDLDRLYDGCKQHKR